MYTFSMFFYFYFFYNFFTLIFFLFLFFNNKMAKTQNNKTRVCSGCGKNFKPKWRNQFFHSVKCRTKFYYKKNKDEMKRKAHLKYLKNKEHILKQTREWALNNPEKRRRIEKRAMKKYLENNREKFNQWQRDYYQKNKEKHLTRSRVNHLLKDSCGYKEKIYKLSKYCFVCNSRYKTWLFYEIYPLTVENMIKAIKQNKIRYLCCKHWREASKKRRLKWLRQQKRKNKIVNIEFKGGEIR